MITELQRLPPPPPPPPPPPGGITVTTSFDFRGSAFFNVDKIDFAAFDFSRAIFSSTQFGTGLISDSVHITGDSFRNFVEVHLANGDTNFSAAGWTFSNFEPFNPLQNDEVDIYGSASSDTITGSAMADSLIGGDGDDVLSGLDGRDIFIGGNGNDRLIGGLGDDLYRLEDVHQAGPLASDFAFDTVVEAAGGGTDTISITRVRDAAKYVLPENVENGRLFGTGAFELTGNALDNLLTGNADTNRLLGMQGNDTISGGDGKDIIGGGSGNDLLDGGNGNDKVSGGGGKDNVTGGTGNDTLTGGVAADIFVFEPGSGIDIITDFKDTGLAGDDAIFVVAYGFSGIGDIGRSASGDDLVLDFGGGNTVTILDYLQTHSLANIRDDIILAA